MLTAADNFSVASYSFHGLHNLNAMNIFGYLESMKYRYNLRTADIWNGYLDSYEDDYINMLKMSIQERGLTVVNMCCDQAHLWDNNPDVRAKNEEMAWKCLAIAEKIGAKTVRIDMGVRESVISDEQMDYIVKKYTEYCNRAASFGAKLGPENHWGAGVVFSEFKRLIDNMQADNFGVLLHLGRWSDAATPEEKNACDIALVKNAFYLHIDYDHCVDALTALPPLRDAGYTGCWAIESGKSTDEYNNVAYMLTQTKRALLQMDYNGGWGVKGPPSVKE